VVSSSSTLKLILIAAIFFGTWKNDNEIPGFISFLFFILSMLFGFSFHQS
jgi:hypothetical protein